MDSDKIVWFKHCSYKNKELVGGKCSSLGELFVLSKKIGFNIADGFAITTVTYDSFIEHNSLNDMIEEKLKNLSCDNIALLELDSKIIRDEIIAGTFLDEDSSPIIKAYEDLCAQYRNDNLEVAIRSSAIAEDMPNASFAGQQDSYLNISGKENILLNVKMCFASLFNARAISYRKTHDIPFKDVKISVAVQKMVRSDLGSAGVAFSLDPETGYDKAIVINSAFGLGELVVSGSVKPDEFILDKRVLLDIFADPIIIIKTGDKNTKIVYDDKGGVKEIDTSLIEKHNLSLTNNQAINLGKFVLGLEEAYSDMFSKKIGVDIEWAIDGKDMNIYIIQVRPETIHSNINNLEISKHILNQRGNILVKGVSVGDKITTGKVCKLASISEFAKFNNGDILVTEMTTPDWEPIMKQSAGIITNKGGRTCHAAIVARELGINAIVGTSNSTEIIKKDQMVTVCCADGEEGVVYEGELPYSIETIQVKEDFKLPVQLMLNVGNPESSFTNSLIPNNGVGLARLEFIINNYIKIHPLALHNYPKVPDDLRKKIYSIIGDHDNGKWYFIKRLARGISKIASAFYPKDVIVRLSDFKSNEYKSLIGGELYEPNEENPMIGWRGASRYYDKAYKEAFELECEAIKYAREIMKMDNVIIMIPFCRTPDECKLVLNELEANGLVRGKDGLKIYIMCEIPSNVIEAEEFSPLIDGVSIGGNDLLQLTLGVDRDSDKITHLSNHTNLSYRRLISQAIQTYKKNGVKVGFCGQQPSDSEEFCKFLIEEHIDSISVTADSALKTIKNLSI